MDSERVDFEFRPKQIKLQQKKKVADECSGFVFILTAAFVTTRTDSFDRNALGSPQLFIIVRTLLVGNKRSSDFSTIFFFVGNFKNNSETNCVNF